MSNLDLSKYKVPTFISYVNLILGFLLGIVTTNLYGLEKVGWLYYNIAIQQIFGFLLTFGIGTYSIKFLTNLKSDRSFFNFLNLIFIHLILILAISLIFFSILISLQNDESLKIYSLIFLMIFISTIRFIVEDLLLGLGYFKYSVLQSFIESISRLILIVIFSLNNESDILKILIISSIIPLLINFFLFINKISHFRFLIPSISFFVDYYREALVIFTSHFMAMFHTRSGLIFSAWIFPANIVGAYSLLISISEPILRLGTIISRFFMKAGASANSSGLKNIWRGISMTLMIGLILTLLLGLCFPLLSQFLYQSSLDGYETEFYVLLIYSLSFLLVNIQSNVLNGIGDSRVVLRFSIFMSMLYICLIILSAIKHSFILFTSALSITSLLLSCILAIFLYQKIFRQKKI